jgi:hypothetical protein
LNLGAARGDFVRRRNVGGSEIGIVAGVSHRLELVGSLDGAEKCWFSWSKIGCLLEAAWLALCGRWKNVVRNDGIRDKDKPRLHPFN